MVASPFTTDPSVLLHALHVLPASKDKNLLAVVRQEGVGSEQDPPVVPHTQPDVPLTVWQILVVPLHSEMLPHLQIPSVQVCPKAQDVVSHWHTVSFNELRAHIGIDPEHVASVVPHTQTPLLQECPFLHDIDAQGS